MRFSVPYLSDERIKFASEYLEANGYFKVDKAENSDFILLGINPDKAYLSFDKPIFAGNVKGDNIFDYTKDEAFAIKNAFYTAEGAAAIAMFNSKISLSDSSVLILGYGRIAKALEFYLQPIAKEITICARNESARAEAELKSSKTIDFCELSDISGFDIILNTVPHPVLNQKELSSANEAVLIIDLASFPGGVDVNYAKVKGINLITARGLPGKYSPASAGKAVGETVMKLLKEVKV